MTINVTPFVASVPLDLLVIFCCRNVNPTQYVLTAIPFAPQVFTCAQWLKELALKELACDPCTLKDTLNKLVGLQVPQDTYLKLCQVYNYVEHY